MTAVNGAAPPIGVLIMAYGGPSSLVEIPGYLADIRSGRPTSTAVLEEITHNYDVIGGRSPLPEISRRQVDAVQARLDPAVYRCYLGMRHWAPWIEDVVGEMVEGDDSAVVHGSATASRVRRDNPVTAREGFHVSRIGHRCGSPDRVGRDQAPVQHDEGDPLPRLDVVDVDAVRADEAAAVRRHC